MDNYRFRRRRRLAPLVLAASLSANLFLGGWIISDCLLGPRAQLQPLRPAETIAADIAAVMPPADAALLRRSVAEHRADLERARTSYFLALDYLRGTLSAKEFDPAAFRTAIHSVRESRQNERSVFVDALADAIVEMSPEGRKAFVDKHLGGGLKGRMDERK